MVIKIPEFLRELTSSKNVKKKPVLSPVALQPFLTSVTYYESRASKYTYSVVDNSRAPLGLNLLGSRTPYEINEQLIRKYGI